MLFFGHLLTHNMKVKLKDPTQVSMLHCSVVVNVIVLTRPKMSMYYSDITFSLKILQMTQKRLGCRWLLLLINHEFNYMQKYQQDMLQQPMTNSNKIIRLIDIYYLDGTSVNLESISRLIDIKQANS